MGLNASRIHYARILIWVGDKDFCFCPRNLKDCCKHGWKKGSLQSLQPPLQIQPLMLCTKYTQGLWSVEQAPQKITIGFNYSMGLPTLNLHTHLNNFWLDSWQKNIMGPFYSNCLCILFTQKYKCDQLIQNIQELSSILFRRHWRFFRIVFFFNDPFEVVMCNSRGCISNLILLVEDIYFFIQSNTWITCTTFL